MSMTRVAALGVLLLIGSTLAAQRPSDPALLIPETAPPLDYAPVANPITLPEGTKMGATAAVAFDAKGHLFVLARGGASFFEFDPAGTFVRSFGDPMTRAHGLRIDRDGNLWATDVGAHTVMKFNMKGELLLTIGVKGQAGAWDEAAGERKLNQPNDIAIAANGDVFVVQGHTPGLAKGDARVLKFDKTGRFIKSWGGKGKGPGQFDVAHGIAIDAKGLLWVMDRENQRIQVFDAEGTFVREMKYAGLPCSVDIGREFVYMVNGFAGQLLRMDLNGKVLAATGKPGTALGEFGEAHFLAVSPKNELYVADSVNGALVKFVKK
jgi:DNA-binding beta-propeller fold protein YncE